MVRAARFLIAAMPLAALAQLAVAPAAFAQIPDKFTNLQVLPKEIAKGELVDTMKSWTRALGVRCEHCHVYRSGVDPETAEFTDFDWPADGREAKATARLMVQLVRSVNADHLAKLPGGPTMSVGCITCHHGVPVPETIDHRLAGRIAEAGVDAAIADYRELREEYLTAGAYDFGERPLLRAAESRLVAKQPGDALALANLAVELFAGSSMAHHLRGEALLAGGDREAARAAFAKSVELDPENPMAGKRLAELSTPPPEPVPTPEG